MSPRAVLLTCALAGAGLFGAWRWRGVAPLVPPAVEAAPLPPPPALGPFLLGVNEGVSVPQRVLDETGGAGLAEELARDGEDLRRLGARSVRGHTGAFPRLSKHALDVNPDRLVSEGDAWVSAVQAAGLDPILMVSPWPANQTANATEEYLPPDMAVYEAYVRSIVERYDHDGVDDMPGLVAPVRWFEVDNEPDLKFNDPPRNARREFTPQTFCPPEEYAQVLIASARAIRAASPEAKVLGAAVFRPHAASGADYLRDLADIPGVPEALDVVSFHTYQGEADGARLAEGLGLVRSLFPSHPVWVTETSAALDDEVDEEAQGRLVATLTGVAAIHGAGRLYWHTLSDPPARPRGAGPGGFATNSLLRGAPGGERVEKPAGAVFRHLAAALEAHDLYGAVPEGAGAARLRDGSALVWSGSVPAPKGGVSLRTGEAVPAGGSVEAPGFAW